MTVIPPLLQPIADRAPAVPVPVSDDHPQRLLLSTSIHLHPVLSPP